MTLVADSHCHLLDPRLACRAAEIVGRLRSDGLEFVVEISASPTESHEAIVFAEEHQNVFCTVGVHPIMAHEYNQEFEHWMLGQKSKKIVAVGECGLDFYHCGTDKHDHQRQVFSRHIKVADKLKLPLVVHTRNAFDDTLAVLVEHKKHIRNGLLFHCFSESAVEIVRIRKHFDAYFAFGGAVTYRNKTATVGASDEAIRVVPLDRLLVETDAPYLKPAMDGKKDGKAINEPKNVRIVAEYIATVLGTSFETVAHATLENTKRFYRI